MLRMLLIVLWLILSIKSETQESTIKPEIIIQTEFDYENENLVVVSNEKFPDFTVYFTKEDTKTDKGSIYRFDKDARKFVVVTFNVDDTTIVKSLHKLFVTGEKMWGFSKIHKYAFYINKDYTHENAESIEINTEFMVHPHKSDVIIKYTNNKNGVHTGLVRAGNAYKPTSFSFKNLDFVPNVSRYVYLSSTNTFSDMDHTDGSIKFTKPTVSDYRKFDDKILLIQSNKVRNTLDLFVYDCDTNEDKELVFPELLKIKEVKRFEYDGQNLYLILVHDDQNTCLWVSTAHYLSLGRTVCTNMVSGALMDSNFYLDNRIIPKIFLNFPHKENPNQTLRSTNKGRVWYEMKFRNPNDSPYNLPVHFEFCLHDSRDVLDRFEEIDIQYTESADGRKPFISYDNGNIWKATPLTNSRLLMLNNGMVLISVDTDTNFINYNLDEAKTWIRVELLKNQPKVLYIGRFTQTDQKALIVRKDSTTTQLIFSVIDFSKFFKTDCTDSQYREWQPSPIDEYCHYGDIYETTSRIPDIQCIDKYNKHYRAQSVCSCTFESGACSFGYQSFGDICIPDFLIRTRPRPKVCSTETSDEEYELGFIKIDEEQCQPDEVYDETGTIKPNFCVRDEYTDFLVLYTADRMYMYRISALVNQIRKMPPVLFDPLLKARVDRPIAFDFVNQMTYSFKDNYIIKHPFFGLSQKSIYYLENDITDMTLEPISQVLIFLTRIKQLKVLSFITNFQHLVHVDVVWFRYSHHHKLIWFMTTTNLLCHCRLLESPDCNQHDSGYLKAFVDSTNLKGYFLTAQNELRIQTYRNDIKHIGSVSNRPNVQDFTVDANHLYYVSEGQLIYKDVTTDASVVKLDDRQNFRRLDLYRVTLQNHQNLCKDLDCQFMCLVDRDYHARCICPPNMVQSNNKCTCPATNPDCLKQVCMGFSCKNKRCLLNNVKCNGISECEDGSDESNCSQKCPRTQHLCRGRCISKDIVCNGQHSAVLINKSKPSIIDGRKIALISFLSITFIVSAAIPIYKVIKSRLRMRRIMQMNLNVFDDSLSIDHLK